MRTALRSFIAGTLLLAGTAFAQVIDLGPVPADQRPTRDTELKPSVLKLGVHRALPPEAMQLGQWTPDSDGRQVWRIAVRSREAASLRLEFAGVDLGEGTLSVTKPGGTPGPNEVYKGKGPFNDGHFWSHTVFGDSAEVTYIAPGGDSNQPPRFRVVRASHRFTDSHSLANTFHGQADSCHINVACKPEFAELARSVAIIYIETADGTGACSGALIRTRSNSGTPYFLTADHCVADEAEARSIEAYWNFQSARCNDPMPPLSAAERSPVGARYLVSRPNALGDFSLLLLNGIPASARFAGWDPQDPQLGAALTGIHHPKATQKRITTGSLFVPYWLFSNSNDWPDPYYHVLQINEGALEQGSSGSPLFNARNEIVGMLSYGPNFSWLSVCQQNPRLAGYGRLSTAWPFLAPFLDDPVKSTLGVSPAALTFNSRNRVVTPAARQTLVLTTTSTTPQPVSLRTPEEWIVFSRTSGTMHAAQPFTAEIELRQSHLARSGRYTGTIEAVSGPNLTAIPITANVTVEPSVVTVTASPNPVPASAPDAQGCRYSYRLTIAETAGVATRVTGLRINGQDYASRITEWFGGAALAAQGRLEATLRICAPGAPAPHGITVGGADSATGLNWSRSAYVEFLPPVD